MSESVAASPPSAVRPEPHPLALFAQVGRLHIVAIAAAGLLTFGWLFTGERPWGLAAICALDWFLVNLLNRVVDLPEDEANGIVGTDFVRRHRRGLLRGGFSLLFGSLAATAAVLPAITPLRVAFHLLGFAYNWPLLPGRRRIKALYFWKNTASATGFMLTVFGFPLAMAGWGRDPARLAPGITPATVALCALFFFLFELSYEVIYDLRDVAGDRAEGVRTFPVVHGERGAVRIIDGLVVASVAVLVGGHLAGVVPWRAAVMVVAPVLQLVLYKRALPRGLTSGDCLRLTWLGAGMLAAYHLWIALGLPGVDR
jgi:4-hydroxybenzoate polyprenyltransferase